MRIPPSAIVMTLVVSVPFGLAIRDSIKGNDLQHEQDRKLAEAEAAEVTARAEYAEREAREKKEEQARDEHRKVTFASLLGTARGTLGDRFNTQVGQVPPSGFEATLDSIEDLDFRDGVMPGMQVGGDGKLVSVSLPLGDSHCDEMQHLIEHAWGSADDTIWVDTEHDRRASLYGLLCVLHFDQYVDDAAWAKLALPKILGKTNAQAVKLIGPPTVDIENPILSWYAPGAKLGRDSTEITAIGDEKSIYETRVSTTVTNGQAGDLIDALNKQIGVPAEQDGYEYHWPNQMITATFNLESKLFTVMHTNRRGRE